MVAYLLNVFETALHLSVSAFCCKLCGSGVWKLPFATIVGRACPRTKLPRTPIQRNPFVPTVRPRPKM